MSSPEDQMQLHAIVRGRVQGVSFRYYTVQEALSLGVTGWVRNRPDDTVEVLAEGTRRQLNQLALFLHRGSPSAHVTGVDVSWGPTSGSYTTFAVAYRSTE